MSDSALPDYQPPIRVVFTPYDHDCVQRLLRRVIKEFGRPGDRWRYLSPDINHPETNSWQLDFFFRNTPDAIMFVLKYQL